MRACGGLCNIGKNVGITWSAPHMFLLPVEKYSKLPEMISRLNWRKFHLWCHSPHPTHTEGLIITRTICGVFQNETYSLNRDNVVMRIWEKGWK